MRLTTILLALLILFAAPALRPTPLSAQTFGDVHQIVINADLGETQISRHIYGHFAEHLGRGIYDGFWQQDASGEWGLRQDVVDALRAVNIPNLRWPGGCFADTYHWKDGIGPRDQRPTIVNTHWGGVTEDNSFGTHEFMSLVEALDTEAYIVGNLGSGTVQEMAEWVEYLTFDGKSPMADLRRENGREAPWKVPYWGVGNENWACGGNMRPQYYADLYRRYVTYLRNFGGNRLYRIATGPYAENTEWTDVVMREAGSLIDGISFHYYTLVGSWRNKGAATGFTERDWFVGLRNAMRMDEHLSEQERVLDRYDPGKRVGLIVDEWGMWHDVEPGTNPGFLYQQNTLRDALVASVTLDIFNNHADRVRMANLAQTINVLQAMILTEGDQMILTPTYHVFDMYKGHQDATLLPLHLDQGRYTFEDETIPAISASASVDSTGAVLVTLSNLDPNAERQVKIDVRGATVSTLTGRLLTGEAMDSHNTFETPDRLAPRTFSGARLVEGTVELTLPPKSVVALELR